MRRRIRMGAPLPATASPGKYHGPVVEEIAGLIRLYKDGHVERLPAMPEVPPTWSADSDVTSRDVAIGPSTGVWARVYVPKRRPGHQHLPVLVYFHGGGFCVGSAAWSCYHEFLAGLASRAGCIVLSVNYRLAPEHRLPAAYDDGLLAVKWVRQQESRVGCSDECSWWRSHCDFARVFVGGDSAGAAIAHSVAASLGSFGTPPDYLRGLILIQPFFGGEARTASEKSSASTQSPRSALSLATSDCYWRLALPPGADRDHPWCNPLAKGAPRLEDVRLPPLLLCISETDILRDRNLELCKAMRRAGKSVEHAVYEGVGHAFQVLHNSSMSRARTHEMLTHISGFVNSK